MSTDFDDEIKIELDENLSKTPKRGLGRGLDALFGDSESDTYVSLSDDWAQDAQASSAKSPEMVGVDQLHAGALQPRRSFDDESLGELAESIKAHGVLQPILVRQDQILDGVFEIIAGERRWRAAQLAQQHEVPVIVLDLTDAQALEIGLIENLQRQDLDPIDEAAGYRKLMEEFGHSQERLSEIVGKSRSYIANMVRLLNLPVRVQSYVKEAQLSTGHARALITADNSEDLARRIIDENLSVRETEALIRGERTNHSGETSKAKDGHSKPSFDPNIAALEEELSNAFGLKVQIKQKGQGGQVAINFKTLDELDDFIVKVQANAIAQRLINDE